MTEALSRPALSALIGAIYDCALDPSRWNNVLADIKDALHCQTAALYLLDPRYHRFLMSKVAGVEESYWWDQLDKYAPLINTWLAEGLASGRSLDVPHLMSRHLPRELVYESAYFQERLKPRGIVDLMQLYLVHTATRHAGLGFGRHERQGNFTDGEIELGALLLPHLRRAVVISNVLDVRTIERSRMVEALDALRCAVLLVDAGASILHANKSAEGMLRECGGPFRISRGVLGAKTPSVTRELWAAIRQAAEDEAAIGKAGLAIRLTGSGVPPIFAHVLPLSGGELRARLRPAAVAAVVIGMPADDHDAAEATAAAFGLTAAETRVLAELLAGRTLPETAKALGVAVTTARTHLDSIFAKAGVSRQTELMRLAARLLPPIRSRGKTDRGVEIQNAQWAGQSRRTECKSD